MVLAIQIILIALVAYFAAIFIKDIIAHKDNLGSGNWAVAFVIGFITDALDTLGIGSFAPTTLLLDATKQLENDRQLPGTLNVAHSIPVIVEALLFLTVVKVQPVTLFSLVIAAAVGSLLGSKIIAKMPERKIQFIMGIALIVTAVLMGMKQVGWLDMLGTDNTATGLTGIKLIIGIVGNAVFGALMTAGVGLYAPCMAMVYMLGVSPIVAMPIMMTSCAALMPVASREFIKTGNYARKVSLGITLGGVIGVVLAVNFVSGLDMNILTWVIIAVVIYTGVNMLLKSKKAPSAA